MSSKAHNKSKRRRENKMIMRVLHDPKKWDHMITEAALSGSPIKNIIRPLEVQE